jgi:NADH dehydrogenase FAD-containing subunit
VKERKQLVLVGAGHSNLHLVKNVSKLRENGYQVTLISPSDLYYNGVAPGVLSKYYPNKFGKIEATCHLKNDKGRYIHKKVIGVDLKDNHIHLQGSESIPFDYLSINIGGRVPTNQIPGSSTNSFPIKPIESLWKFTESLDHLIESSPRSISVTIIGGGAAGIEIAGNVQHLIKSQGIKSNITLITKGEAILPQFSSSASTKVSKEFINRGIDIEVNSRVVTIHENSLEIEDGRTISHDLCVLATGIVPDEIDNNGLLLTTDIGELIVNPFLQCMDTLHIFATGDCSFFEVQPLWKSGYHAINQGPILLKNLIAISKGLRLHKYKPSKRVITALNLGSGKGLIVYGKLTFLHKISFKVKDFIEQRYIKSFRCQD